MPTKRVIAHPHPSASQPAVAGPLRDRLLLGYHGTPERFKHAVAQHAPPPMRVPAPGEPLVLPT